MASNKHNPINLKTSMDLSNWVVNPNTGRLIKIGSRQYYALVKDNILKMDGGSRKKNIIYKGPNLDDVKKCMPKRNDDITIVKRDGKLIETRRKINRNEIFSELCIKASDMIKHNMDELDGLEGEDLDKKVKQLINQRMVGEIQMKKPLYQLAESENESAVSSEDDNE